MKKNSIEILNLIIAIFALVVAIVSIWFSYYTYKDNKTERLYVQASFIQSNYQTKIISIGQNVVIPLYWQLILTNNSENTLSITNIDIENIDDERGITFYSHIYDGIFESYEGFDEGQIDLPINISSGESRKVFVRIGIMCDSLASSILLKQNNIFYEKRQSESWTRFNQVIIKLAEKGIDFYSNNSSVTHDNENIILYQSEAKKQQQFKITLTTGKNNFTTKNVRIYMMKE